MRRNATCTVCNEQVYGSADDDVCCSWCEQANFAGDLLRHPPRRQEQPQAWWLTARGPLARQPWRWMEETGHGH